MSLLYKLIIKKMMPILHYAEFCQHMLNIIKPTYIHQTVVVYNIIYYAN